MAMEKAGGQAIEVLQTADELLRDPATLRKGWNTFVRMGVTYFVPDAEIDRVYLESLRRLGELVWRWKRKAR